MASMHFDSVIYCLRSLFYARSHSTSNLREHASSYCGAHVICHCKEPFAIRVSSVQEHLSCRSSKIHGPPNKCEKHSVQE